MTASVRVSVPAGQPRGVNFIIEVKRTDDPKDPWTPAEVGTISQGAERDFPLYPERRVILTE